MYLRLTPKNNPAAILWFIVAILTCVISFRTIFSFPFSIDSYTHIAIGQYILNHHTIPHHSDISFKLTDPSLEWLSHSWLADILLYLPLQLHQSFGVFILIIPLLLLSIYLTVLLLQSIMHKNANYLSVLIAMTCSLSFWRYHPFIFIVPLQLLLMNLLVRWRRHPVFLWSIPVLFLIWANVSGGTIVIPTIYLVAFVIVELIVYHRIWIATIIPVSIAATLVNPYGSRLYVYALTTIAIVRQNRSFSSLVGAINTLNQTYNKQQFSSFYLVLFACYCLILAISFLTVVLKKKVSVQPILILLPSLLFLPLSFFWVRFIPITVFATIPIFSWCIDHLTEQLSMRSRRIGSYVFGVVAIIGLMWLLERPPFIPSPKFPADHITRIREFSLPANILTTYDLTGYSMYALPQYKAMLDAQDDLLNDESLVSIYQPVGNFSQSFDTITNKLSVSTALVSRDIGGLAATLSASDAWRLIYVDYDAALFVHESGMDESFFQSHAFGELKLDRNLGFDPDQSASATAELETFRAQYPFNTLLSGQLATIYRITKQFKSAETIFQGIPKNQWNFALYTEYGRLKAAQGKCIEAEHYLTTALSFRNEKNYSRTVLDLAVLYAGCFKDTKRAKHFFIRYNSFLITTGEREKLHMLAKQFGIDMTQ